MSSVGVYVDRFEDQLKNITGVNHVIAMANGTAALHMALLATNVQVDDEVITQSVSFVATCNSIRYAGAWPVFVDVDEDTMRSESAKPPTVSGTERIKRKWTGR